MNTYEALSLMLGFGMFILALISLIISLVKQIIRTKK